MKMTENEYKAWKNEQKRDAGHWKVDPIHSQREGTLLAYVAQPADPTRGIYVNIEDNVLSCGTFEDAIPHMGEATYRPKKQIECADNNTAWKTAIERLGLTFLLAITHGTSPYRAV